MLDIAFSELIVIGAVALVVIGPEKLPKVAKTAGILLGRAQRYATDIKNDLNRQIQFEELKALQKEMAEQARDLENSVKKQMLETEAALTQSANSLKASVEDAGKEIDQAGKQLAAEVASSSPSSSPAPDTPQIAANAAAAAVTATAQTEQEQAPEQLAAADDGLITPQLATAEDELYRGEPAYIPPPAPAASAPAAPDAADAAAEAATEIAADSTAPEAANTAT